MKGFVTSFIIMFASYVGLGSVIDTPAIRSDAAAAVAYSAAAREVSVLKEKDHVLPAPPASSPVPDQDQLGQLLDPAEFESLSPVWIANDKGGVAPMPTHALGFALAPPARIENPQCSTGSCAKQVFQAAPTQCTCGADCKCCPACPCHNSQQVAPRSCATCASGSCESRGRRVGFFRRLFGRFRAGCRRCGCG